MLRIRTQTYRMVGVDQEHIWLRLVLASSCRGSRRGRISRVALQFCPRVLRIRCGFQFPWSSEGICKRYSEFNALLHTCCHLCGHYCTEELKAALIHKFVMSRMLIDYSQKDMNKTEKAFSQWPRVVLEMHWCDEFQRSAKKRERKEVGAQKREH